MNTLKFSVIVPVFNRPDETRELLESLTIQQYKHFEVIIVEDGSSLKSESIVENFSDKLDIHYYFKQNTGPGDSRNFGARKSSGDYLVFFDSDCIVPAEYFKVIANSLSVRWLDVYGGPDKAPGNANAIQQAINYSMTSLLTTGGIRGHRFASKTFQPRSFNMGISKDAFLKTGGFSNIHPGEDPDLVYRLVNSGYTKGLIQAFVYHKRRVNFKGFATQIYKFGLVRTILMKWHPQSRKPAYVLPTILILAGICCFILGFSIPIFWYFIALGLGIIFVDALYRTANPVVALIGVTASVVQIAAYGGGFFIGWWQLFIRRRDEQSSFPFLFRGP